MKNIKGNIITLLLFIVIISIFSISFYLVFNNNTEKKLIKIGYNTEEVSYIIENVNKDTINQLLSADYDKNIINILKNKEYKDTNIKKYLQYINENNLDIDIAIYLVNNNIEYNYLENIINDKNYDKDKIATYYKYKNEYNLDDKNTIFLVNKNVEFNENISSFLNEKYFIENNLDRYLKYQENNNLSHKEIIKLVNSNRDFPYYDNSSSTDLTKNYLILVNKYYYLNKDYVPNNLVALSYDYTDNACKLEGKTYEQFKKLVDDAKKEGLNIICHSGYRSYNDQNYIYNSYVKNNGLDWANKYSAKPGYSEHQTGLAIDLRAVTNNDYGQFVNTPEFKWMQKNAHLYGFILRFLNGEENITGYNYEPWHYRYVGIDDATNIYNLGITYEEYYAYYVK